MAKNKRSFFERLTGAISIDEYDSDTDDAQDFVEPEFIDELTQNKEVWQQEEPEEEDTVGQLTIDVFQTPTHVVIKTMVAGVRPEDLDISITREMVTISGKREAERNISQDNYYHQELYWGEFSRTIMLPQEVECEDAEAVEDHGLLIIRLPKINKDKETKLKVRSRQSLKI